MSTRTAAGTGSPTPVTSPKQATAGATAVPTPGDNIAARNIEVQLQYLKDDPVYDKIKPLQITPNFADREGRTNVVLAAGETETIRDVRGVEHNFTLDNNGFKYVKAPTPFKEWSSQPRIAQDYLPELEQLLKQHVDGCDEVMFYDARLRQSGDAGLRVEGLSYNPFAKQVHLDNTEPSVITKIRSLTDLKADYLLSGRARIINIWRPIKHPVYDCGLAVADAGKLRKNDILECDRVNAKTQEFWDTMGVAKFRQGFEWYYCSFQDEEDVLLFKGYDSAVDVKARHCLHTAFDVPTDMIPKNAPTRESIEVRALVFTYPSNLPRPSGEALPHPLAVTLQQSNLKLLDDEHSLTDHVRTDIDEADEMKDAVLLLRRQEIRRLERLNETVTAERDRAKTEVMRAQKQIGIQTPRIEALEAENRYLQQQAAQSYPDLRRQLNSASRELTQARVNESSRTTTHTGGFGGSGEYSRDDAETVHLLETIERQAYEIQQWKAAAMGKGSEAVSRSWQGSVDEAVRREREKDAFVVDSLRKEVERMRQGA